MTRNVRLDIARDVLLAMINNAGSKRDKARAAVEYADILLHELSQSRSTSVR